MSPHTTIPGLRFSSRGSMRRVSSSNRGRAMGGERSVRIGACPGRREVSRLERIRVGTDVPGARKRGGGRLIEPDGVLEELKGSRVRDATLIVRLLFCAKSIGAKARKLGRAVRTNPLALLDGASGTDAVDRSSRSSHVDAWQGRPKDGTAAARYAGWLEVRPCVIA